MSTFKFSSVESPTFTVSNINGPVISTSRHVVKKVKGLYGCQEECSKIYANAISDSMSSLSNSAVHMRTIVISFSRAKVQKMIADNWFYCVTCTHAFHPSVCQGHTRKICPCCTTRLNALKTVLKKSTVQKIRDSVLLSRVE